MTPKAADKIAALEQKLRRMREHGIRVIVRDDDGSVLRVRHLRRRPDGELEWSDVDRDDTQTSPEGAVHLEAELRDTSTVA